MAWIESHDEMSEHPKLFKLMDSLGISQIEAVGHLHCLWHFTLKYAWQDGDLKKFGDAAIAKGAKWAGAPQALIKALQESGWLDEYIVHDWKEYASYLIYQRKYNKNRKRKNTDESLVSDTCKTDGTKPNPSKPIKTDPIQAEKEFLLFWNSYPKKSGKKLAKKSWDKLKPDGTLLQIILEAIRIQSQSIQWKKDDGQFIPNPATWLNQERWNDEMSKQPTEQEEDSWKRTAQEANKSKKN